MPSCTKSYPRLQPIHIYYLSAIRVASPRSARRISARAPVPCPAARSVPPIATPGRHALRHGGLTAAAPCAPRQPRTPPPWPAGRRTSGWAGRGRPAARTAAGLWVGGVDEWVGEQGRKAGVHGVLASRVAWKELGFIACDLGRGPARGTAGKDRAAMRQLLASAMGLGSGS